jgi:hypothetical protein
VGSAIQVLILVLVFSQHPGEFFLWGHLHIPHLTMLQAQIILAFLQHLGGFFLQDHPRITIVLLTSSILLHLQLLQAQIILVFLQHLGVFFLQDHLHIPCLLLIHFQLLRDLKALSQSAILICPILAAENDHQALIQLHEFEDAWNLVES